MHPISLQIQKIQSAISHYKNYEKNLARAREWKKKNKDKVYAARTRWDKAHPEVNRKSSRDYYKKHKPEIQRKRKERHERTGKW